MEMYPNDFDSSRIHEYAVLFYVYGGPDSQNTAKTYNLDINVFLASQDNLKMIVVCVDGRGTGFKNRRYSTITRGRLGLIETEDINTVGEYYKSLPFVDPKRVGIWGWVSFVGLLLFMVYTLLILALLCGSRTAGISHSRSSSRMLAFSTWRWLLLRSPTGDCTTQYIRSATCSSQATTWTATMYLQSVALNQASIM